MPGGRRSSTIDIGGQIITKKTRPFAVADKVFRDMADETAKANARYIKVVCDDLAAVLDRNGGKFRLRGAKGNRVPLEGRSDVKAFFTQGDRAFKVVGAVRGIPEGFWHIVEYGSYRRHMIYSRESRSGLKRISQSGKQRQDFLTKKQVQRRFNRGGNLSELKPIRTPWGPRQYVIKTKPNRPIGTPWAESMVEAVPLVTRDMVEIQGTAMVRSFIRGG